LQIGFARLVVAALIGKTVLTAVQFDIQRRLSQ
jgi:hypothetical protein